MSSIFTVHRQPYGEVMNPISPDSVRFHDKNGNVTEVSMVDGMVNIRVGGVTVSAEYLEDLMRQMFGRGEHPPAEAQPVGGGEEGFKAWVVEQMPAGTVIDNPAWWADRLARAYALNVPQPPAEAQPVAWLSDWKHAANGGVTRDADIAAAWEARGEVTPLYAHPPPSAPVGVKGLLTCYQCGKTVTWLAPDSRCGDCTRLTPDEVRGQ